MPADKYRFVSPGVFMTEIDQSQVPNLGNDQRGPVIIGRSSKGPSYTPTKVFSYNEFVQIFGETVPGSGGGDVWRRGNLSSPMYATYAAKAYLANNSPITFVRLLGAQEDDAGTDASTGAAGWKMGGLSAGQQAGAYGLFIVASSSIDGPGVSSAGEMAPATGTLAAIFYASGAVPILSGTVRGDTSTATLRNNTFIRSATSDKEFKIAISGSNSTFETKAFNFNRNSPKFIRKVFNTDPTRFNETTTTTSTRYKYFLGETYEKAVNNMSASADGTYYAFITGLMSGSADGGDFRGTIASDGGPNSAATGWFISQDLSAPTSTFNPATNTTNLFKLHGLHANGEQTQKEIKISIRDIRYPSVEEETVNPYPTFTVEIRSLRDTDKRKRVIETYTNCDLNPNSANFISRKIGDKYLAYNSTSKRMQEYGSYGNVSKYVRVEVTNEVEDGAASPSLMPFGVKGPLKFKSFEIHSGSASQTISATGRLGSFVAAPSGGGNFIVTNKVTCSAETPALALSPQGSFTGSFEFPSLSLMVSSSDLGFTDHRDAYFGVNVLQTDSQTRFDEGTLDLIKVKPLTIDNWDPGVSTDYQYVFTLDNIIKTGSDGVNLNANSAADAYYYQSGSRATETSLSAVSGAAYVVNTAKVNKFTTVLHGGFDALDITEKDPFRNTYVGTAGATKSTNYALSSLLRAIDIVTDTEALEYNLATIPGITVASVTDKLVDVCEERADALAIIDLENDYQPLHEGSPDNYPILPNIASAVTSMKNRSTNSSYGCAFYPWVQTRDAGTGQMLWIPPSVAALGTMGSSAARSELWFAPAGFNRGGLSKGAAGIPITNVRTKLTSRERDDLYDVRINPIASFPSEGIVVFGQKTLQLQASALDRINVRRLLLFIKKKISNVANTILFDQNVPATWARFIGMADPILQDVQSKFGLEDYKLILDDSTTTPELRDRNVMYAKVYLKPAKSIEYIAIDFFITSSGAAFED